MYRIKSHKINAFPLISVSFSDRYRAHTNYHFPWLSVSVCMCVCMYEREFQSSWLTEIYAVADLYHHQKEKKKLAHTSNFFPSLRLTVSKLSLTFIFLTLSLLEWWLKAVLVPIFHTGWKLSSIAHATRDELTLRSMCLSVFPRWLAPYIHEFEFTLF